MRLFTSVIASAIFLAASGASALTSFLVNDSGPHSLAVGDTITFEIRFSDGIGVFGLGASAWGYDESVVDFVSGQSVASINHATCFTPAMLPPNGQCFSGLSNVAGGALAESSVGASGNRVLIFNGVGLTATNSNPLDPGLNGIVGGNDAQVRITFTAVAPGTTQIRFGTGYNGDGEVLEGGVTDTSQNVHIDITVVPEPGTALLMGLGLAGLAAAGRRS